MSKLKVGKSEKGKVLHLLFEHDGKVQDRPHCDKRQTGLVVVKGAGVAEITCAKCSKLKIVQDTLEKATAPTPPANKEIGLTAAPVKAKPKAKPKPKKKSKPKPKATKAPAKKAEDYDFVSQKKGDKFNIYHLPSKRNFFENLPGPVVDFAVSNLNDMEMRWSDSKEKIPPGFVSKCREALVAAYEKAELPVPKFAIDKKSKSKAKKKEKKVTTRKFKKGDELMLNDVLHEYDGKNWAPKKEKRKIKRRKKVEPEKAKRVIKRRVKAAEKEKPKRKIKRRSKPVYENEFQNELAEIGFRPGHAPASIAEYIADEDGARFDEVIEMLMDRFKISEKRAVAKTHRIVRKLARQFGYPIVITMGESENEDHYKLERVGP
jgi:hypothetical protein